MTLFRAKRSLLTKGSLLTLAALFLVCGRSLALTIISPTEGAMVREKVRIVIPRTAIPTDGFVAISIDGMFKAADALPEEVKSGKNGAAPASPYYTYIWDTKAPVYSFGQINAPVNLKDGKHDVEVQVHDALGRRVSSAKVSVHLANKAAVTNPQPALKLYYRFRLGDQAVYHCKVDGEILDNLGQPLMSGQSAVRAEFDIIQSVEEARSDGTALVRYKIGKDGLVLMYGQQSQMAESQMNYPSVYKEIDSHGRILQSNIVRKTTATVTEILPVLPSKPVRPGESWPSEFKLKIEGIGDIVPFQMSNVLDSIEWEGGRECAKIVTNMTALGKMNMIPGQSEEQTPVKGTGTFFFAYKTGKLIKASAILESTMSIDQSTLDSLKNGSGPVSGPSMPAYGPSSQPLTEELSDDQPDGRMPGRRPGRRAPTVSVYGPSAVPTPGGEKTTVKVRLNWSLDIKK